MKKLRVLIFAGYGFNCEQETGFAFEKAGAAADIVHINDLIAAPSTLRKYQIIAFPGGFSYGDDTGSGNAYAQKIRNHLGAQIDAFAASDRLVIGICNGCQVVVNLGIVPALDGNGSREVALLTNDSARYTVRWTDLANESSSPWLAGITNLSLPIAHGEGKFSMKPQTLRRMKQHGMIALRYVRGEVDRYQSLPTNPTGTLENIAAITNKTGNVLAIMPHPERAISFTQLPHWTYLKEKLKREHKQIPQEGPGLQIFRNAVQYFS